MPNSNIITDITREYHKKSVPDFGSGDTVKVSVKVVESGRERIQVFEGMVLQRRSGGITENFTVRRIGAHGIGVERTFPVHAPTIDKIEVVRRGIVRRSNLTYLRTRTGKAARIKERRNVFAEGSSRAPKSAAPPIIPLPVASAAPVAEEQGTPVEV